MRAVATLSPPREEDPLEKWKPGSSLPPPGQDELEELTHTKMASWYSPLELTRTAIDMAVSSLVAGRSDYRMIEALVRGKKFFDYSQSTREGKNEIWFDYVADVGDGFNSTYAIAYMLGRKSLHLSNRRVQFAEEEGSHTLPRGEFLIMGGDEVYPSASRLAYHNRLVRPYEAALPKVPEGQNPHLFAIPGNHDWYDGLTSFMRLFGQERTIGVWKTRQKRSYFALKLPHGYWLFGVDIQLDADIDKPQIDYFCRIARGQMKAGDKIILCTAEPEWVSCKEAPHPTLQSNLGYFEKVVHKANGSVKIVARLSGDLHHYRRHTSRTGVHNIIAGGGGAFMHPTHDDARKTVRFGARNAEMDYELQASFPTADESRKLAWRNLLFLFHNPGFGLLSAICYAFLSLVLLGPSPGILVCGLVIVGMFVAFTDTPKLAYRITGGVLHGLSHLLAVLAVTHMLGRTLGFTLLQDQTLISVELKVMLAAMVAGAIVGPTLMGLYLLISVNLFGRHGNEAFSALRIQDYKNFLRIHIDEQGLTIYPIGLRRVPRKWRVEAISMPGEPLIVPEEDLEPELIEEAIHIANETQKAEGAQSAA